MARRIAYSGAAVIALADVASQCLVEPEDLQPALIEGVIIPGVTAQAEQRTGAAIREAEYEEDWPETYPSGSALDLGQASEVLSLKRVLVDGSVEDLSDRHYLQRGQRESFLHFPDGRPSGVLRIRYKAGFDVEAYPGVRMWLLMSAASAYAFRETLVVAGALAELPPSFTDSLLAEITVPPRF